MPNTVVKTSPEAFLTSGSNPTFSTIHFTTSIFQVEQARSNAISPKKFAKDRSQAHCKI